MVSGMTQRGLIVSAEDKAKNYARQRRPRRPGEITCKDCGRPSDENDKVWMGRRCVDCTNAWQRHNAATNPRTKRARLKAQLSFRYGMTLAQWDEMLSRQGGRCAICGHMPDKSRGKRDHRLHVDHCHRTKRIRALLCLQCNLLIGHAMECPDRLAKAAAYVAQFNS